MIERVAIADIQIGERRRQDLGDITSLAKNIDAHGLIHPIVISTDNELIAGERLGLSPRASYYAVRRGMFPVVRNGSRMFVPVRAFENWLEGASIFPTWPQKGAPE